VKKWAEEALDFARELDWLGDANQHPEGSEIKANQTKSNRIKPNQTCD
jgi:hypothetical protein